MWMRGLPELADESIIAHWRAAHRLSCWLTRPARALPARQPGQCGLRGEPLECQTSDGLRLAGWVVEPRRPRGTVLLFHPLRRNRAATLEWSRALAACGYRSVAFDHRAHGESEGWRTSFGWWERLDVRAARDLAAERWPAEPCAALGMGMGGSALCFSGAEARFDAVILHALPEKLSRIFESAVAASPHPARGFLDMVQDVTERRLRVRLEQLAPGDHLAELPAPLLVQPGQPVEEAGPAVSEFLGRWLR